MSKEYQGPKFKANPFMPKFKPPPPRAGMMGPVISQDWNLIQRMVTDFANEKFGDPENPLPPLHHLKGEVDELIENPIDLLEYADCMILLIQSALKVGYNMDVLFYAIQTKHAMNKKRKWGEPDENGVVQHIKED